NCTEKRSRTAPGLDHSGGGQHLRAAYFPLKFHRRLRCTGLHPLQGVITVQTLKITSDCASTTRVLASFQSGTRTARPGVSHSVSAEFLPCLRLPPAPYGTTRKAAYLPRRASETFPEALRPFPVPEQFSPGAGGNLQIWARRSSYAIVSQICPPNIG